MTAIAPTLGVGMAGYSFMGRAHSHAWRNVSAFFDLPVRPRLVALAGRNAEAVTDAAARLGWDSAETDWRRLLERDDIGLIDICTPGSSHAEIAIAALEAGKHVLCEKPLANTSAEAAAMVAAAAKAASAGVKAMVGFNYRRVPAVELARRLVLAGRIGEIRHVRAQYLQDWIVDPAFPLVWRLDQGQAGSGALGDIGSHIIDLAQHVSGSRIASVSGLTETFIRERPLGGDAAGVGAVTVDDAALFVARFRGGAVGTFEATRFATGRKNALRLEISGSLGSIGFDLERLNELELYESAGAERGFRRVLVTESDHPWVSGWWPPGHVLGWEHTFVHQAADFLTAIGDGTDPSPGFADGYQVQRVLDAVLASAATDQWTNVATAS